MTRRRKRTFFLLILCIATLIGCSRTRIVDKISIIHVFGFDKADNGEIIGSALIPDYEKDKSGSEIQFLVDRAESSSLLLPKLGTRTSKPIEVAKIRVIVFGKDYAESGIQNAVERLFVTPQLGTNVQIAVSTHKAEKTLEVFKKEKSLTLYERLEHNMIQQFLPLMNLHVFLNHFFADGMDAYIPTITIDDTDLIKVIGIGVFKDDKLKLQLNPDETFLFAVIKDTQTQGTYKIEIGENEQSEMFVIRAFRSISKWDWDPFKEEVNLVLNLEWTLVQYPDKYTVHNGKDLAKIKKIISEKLHERIEDLLKKFKENGVDPLGIGNLVRSQDRNWDKQTFYEKYPSLPINIDINLNIVHSGLEN